MENTVIDDIKASVDDRISQTCEVVVSDTCSGFLYILWLNHPKMDFSFFAEEAIEEMKWYVTKAAKDVEASTPLNPTEVVPPAIDSKAKVQPTEASEVQPAEATAPPS